MAIDRTLRGRQDCLRINLSQEHEIRYWCEALGVDEETLRDTIERVGSQVSDVIEAVEYVKHGGPRPANVARPLSTKH